MPRLIDYVTNIYGVHPDTPVVVGDEILRAIDDRPQRQWEPADFSPLYPPFQRFFVEATNGTPHPVSGYPFYMGMLFEERTDEILANYQRHAYPYDKRTRWVYRVQGYSLVVPHRVYWFPGCLHLHISEEGHLLDNLNRIAVFVSADEVFDPYRHMPISDFTNALPFSLLTLAYMNSRNVVLRQQIPHRPPANKAERVGKPEIKYYTLWVGKKARRDIYTPTDPVERMMAEHLRRGTRKYYADEDGHRLFGRLSGWFYIPSTTVGSREAGLIKKKYGVKP